MARIRYIKPDFFLDEHLSDLNFKCRLGFAGLWCHADKRGRLEDSPKKLKAQIFPYDKLNMDELLDSLCAKPFIIRYESNHKKYIQILNFEEHQKPHHTEKESLIPEFNGQITVMTPLKKGRNGEGNGDGEGNGEVEGLTACQPVKHGMTDFEFFETLKANPAYKGLDIDGELAKMDGWLLARPGRVKTRRFVINWLNKCDKVVSDGKHGKSSIERLRELREKRVS